MIINYYARCYSIIHNSLLSSSQVYINRRYFIRCISHRLPKQFYEYYSMQLAAGYAYSFIYLSQLLTIIVSDTTITAVIIFIFNFARYSITCHYSQSVYLSSFSFISSQPQQYRSPCPSLLLILRLYDDTHCNVSFVSVYRLSL